MGRSYIPVITDVDSNEIVHAYNPHDLNDGAKLMEHAWRDSLTPLAVEARLYRNQKRLIWACDEDPPCLLSELYELGENLWGAVLSYIAREQCGRLAWVSIEDMTKPITHPQRWHLAKTAGDKARYAINHTRGEYIDLGRLGPRSPELPRVLLADSGAGSYFPAAEKVLDPLPLLTVATHQVMSVGDYQGPGAEWIGAWSGDVISTDSSTKEIADDPGYCEINPGFFDRRQPGYSNRIGELAGAACPGIEIFQTNAAHAHSSLYF